MIYRNLDAYHITARSSWITINNLLHTSDQLLTTHTDDQYDNIQLGRNELPRPHEDFKQFKKRLRQRGEASFLAPIVNSTNYITKTNEQGNTDSDGFLHSDISVYTTPWSRHHTLDISIYARGVREYKNIARNIYHAFLSELIDKQIDHKATARKNTIETKF